VCFGSTIFYSYKLGVIYVVDELDYEQKKQYELTVRATDSVSGVYAEVLVRPRRERLSARIYAGFLQHFGIRSGGIRDPCSTSELQRQ